MLWLVEMSSLDEECSVLNLPTLSLYPAHAAFFGQLRINPPMVPCPLVNSVHSSPSSRLVGEGLAYPPPNENIPSAKNKIKNIGFLEFLQSELCWLGFKPEPLNKGMGPTINPYEEMLPVPQVLFVV